MTSAGAIVELMRTNLFDVFNQRDAERRLAVIRRPYTPDVLWSDPQGVFVGMRSSTCVPSACWINRRASCSPRPVRRW